ncbi:MAG: LysE family transporter, partial [Pseudomonadota bacterium]
LGSIATTHDGNLLAFGVGAVSASFVFFFALGFGARLLAPIFERPGAWRVLDVCVGLLMWLIAGLLVFAP